jgi:SAM-dependent methyltransferase
MQTDPTETALTAQADTIGRQRWFREVIWRHLRGLPEDACIDRLNTVIHPNDQMLLHSLRHHGDAQVALSQYYNVALQQYNAARQILRGLFASEERIEILDFACGYGRLLRFLSLMTPPSDIHASDIQPDAVAFVTQQFGGPRGSVPHRTGTLRPRAPVRFHLGRVPVLAPPGTPVPPLAGTSAVAADPTRSAVLQCPR